MHVHVLDDLGELLAERASGMDGNGKNAGHRAETEGVDEHQGKHDLGHGPAELQQPPRGEPQRSRAGQVGGGKEAEDEGRDGAEQGADIGDEQRVEQQGQPSVEIPEPLLEVGAEALCTHLRQDVVEVADEARQAVPEPCQVDLADPRRQHGKDHDQGQATAWSSGAWPRQQRHRHEQRRELGRREQRNCSHVRRPMITSPQAMLVGVLAAAKPRAPTSRRIRKEEVVSSSCGAVPRDTC